MKQIFKYILTDTTQYLTLRGEPISVINQHDDLILYAYHDTKERERTYHVCGVGTGRPMKDEFITEYQFLGTVSMFGGKLIWHIFVKECNSQEVKHES